VARRRTALGKMNPGDLLRAKTEAVKISAAKGSTGATCKWCSLRGHYLKKCAFLLSDTARAQTEAQGMLATMTPTQPVPLTQSSGVVA